MKIPLKNCITDVAFLYFDKRVTRGAAALSYFLTLSLFPLLICINAIMGSMNLSEETLISIFRNLVSKDVLNVITGYYDYVTENTSTSMLVAGIVTTVTCSSAAFRILLGTMADIRGENRFTGVWGFILSIAVSILLLFFMYVIGIVILSGRWLADYVEKWIDTKFFSSVWIWLRYIIMFFMIYIMISLIYSITAPSRKVRVKIGITALLPTACLGGISILFSAIVGMTVRYKLVYGSLASIIILMAWLYICGIILIMGGALDSVIQSYRENPGKRPLAGKSLIGLSRK